MDLGSEERREPSGGDPVSPETVGWDTAMPMRAGVHLPWLVVNLEEMHTRDKRRHVFSWHNGSCCSNRDLTRDVVECGLQGYGRGCLLCRIDVHRDTVWYISDLNCGIYQAMASMASISPRSDVRILNAVQSKRCGVHLNDATELQTSSNGFKPLPLLPLHRS